MKYLHNIHFGNSIHDEMNEIMFAIRISSCTDSRLDSQIIIYITQTTKYKL